MRNYLRQIQQQRNGAAESSPTSNTSSKLMRMSYPSLGYSASGSPTTPATTAPRTHLTRTGKKNQAPIHGTNAAYGSTGWTAAE